LAVEHRCERRERASAYTRQEHVPRFFSHGPPRSTDRGVR
jgi:hypothetical protein